MQLLQAIFSKQQNRPTAAVNSSNHTGTAGQKNKCSAILYKAGKRISNSLQFMKYKTSLYQITDVGKQRLCFAVHCGVAGTTKIGSNQSP